MKKVVLIVGILVAFTMCLSTAKAADSTQIAQAIEDGLAWLAGKQNPADGSWGALYEKVGKTGLAVKKFEHDAIVHNINPLDPAYQYYPQVKGGLDYLFLNAHTVAIDSQTHGHPDTDRDGIGVYFDGGHPTYTTGIALMAIVESWCPDSVVDVPGSDVDGWRYDSVAVDAMNWLAYAQIDAGTNEGGWGYSANSGGDQSNSGYATLGLAYSEASSPEGFGLTVPQFVKDELGDPGLWIDWIQNDVGVGDPQYDGGSGYSGPDDRVNILETGNLLFEMAWYGDNATTQRVKDAIAYIVLHWPDPGYTWPADQGWHGNYQAMYTMMKGLEGLQINQIDGINWFNEVSDSIVATQHANGSWGPDFWDNWVGGDTVLSTTWALLTLQKAAPPVGIPTLTEWGLIIFGVMLIGFITWVFLRRRKAVVSVQ